MKTHPAADLFPMMSKQAFSALKCDIEANGLREPIWTHDGLILDGRNRYRACCELGIAPETREYTGDSPTAFVWSLNGTRRHLTTSQLGAVAAKMQPALQAEAAKRKAANLRQGAAAPSAPIGADGETDEAPTGKSRDIAAKIVGVGSTTVDRAQFVMRNDPELFKRVEAGEITVAAAERAIKTKEAPEPYTKKSKSERIEQIKALAAEGYRLSQIASELNLRAGHVRNIANSAGIQLPDAKFGKVHSIDATDLIERTVHGVDAYTDGLNIIKGAALEIEPDVAREFVASLTKAIRQLGWLKKQLKEISS